MGKPPEGGGLRTFFIIGILVIFYEVRAQEYGCPPQEKILPCRCSTRDMEFQIWCSHSELPRVLEGLKAVSRYVSHPIDELILENNNLPSLPGQVFASLRVLRLMLRNNRLERVSSGWLEGLHDSLLELFLVEPDLRSLPADSLENLQGLEAVTLQSKLIKRLPSFTGLLKLRYLQINSPGLIELTPRNFRDLPSLEQFHVFGSPKLTRFEAGLLRDLKRLQLVNVSDCGIQWIHPRTFINLPELKELTLAGNSIQDAIMVGRAVVDLPSLSTLQLDRNMIVRLTEGSFIDLPSLSRLSLSFNRITDIFTGTFERVPSLRVLNFNHNRIHRIHPEFFIQRGRETSGVEEIWLMDNDIGHISEIRSVLDASPRLKLLEASFNQIQDIGYGALRGHSNIERLHLDYNQLNFLQREAFADMPALRELRLRNNSLVNSPDAPFWNLPALKGLDLSGNFFRHVESRLLANLPSLRRLDLSDNTIALVEPDAFLSLPFLEHINMSGNALSVLHPMTFQHLTNLYELDVGWNRLLEIIPGLPRNMEHLYLPMNRIVALPVDLESHSLTLPLLRSLDLSANGIERLTPGALGALPSLRKLNLGFNALTNLEEGSFDGLARLELLDLKYNRIGELHSRCFRPLRSLLDLNLRGNRIELIRPDVFQDNIILQRLDISRNNLAQLPHTAFAFTRELRELYASHNALPELPSSLHGLEALQILDLSFNKLTSLTAETLSSLTSLLELKLARNRIRELREGAFDRLPRLVLIDLESNDLVLVERNAIKGLPELQAIRLGKNRIQMVPSGAFSELPMLQSAELQENRLQEIANNAFINVPHLLFLNLSHNLLSSLEHMGLESLRSLEVLDLSDNRVTRVSSESLATLEWLVELKMDNNRICIIQGSPFDDMPRLRVLSLRSNRMALIAEDAFKRLRSNIAILDIDGNPLSCSCGMLWLRGWLQQASSEGPRCADGSLFREIRLSKQDCYRERQLEPVYPGCESEILDATSTSISPHYSLSPWKDIKKPQRVPAQDYTYGDYDDYPQEANSTDLSNTLGNVISSSSASPSSVTIVTPQAIAHKVQTLRPKPPYKNSTNTTVTSSHKPAIPPSPSSSGFTFFGVPLPNLNFNLWGNAGRKADRKDDSSGISSSTSSLSSSTSSLPSRPGRSRYKNFPPTEPEIHRGGFMPLPRGQGGFIPITDPRLEQQPLNASSDGFDNHPNVPKNLNKEIENGSRVMQERKHLKLSNYNVGKVERTSGPMTSNQNYSNSGSAKSRQPNRGREKLSTTVSIQKQPVIQDSSVETDETLVSTEVYDDETLNNNRNDKDNKRVVVPSRVDWPIKPKNNITMIKETSTANIEIFPSRRRNTGSDRSNDNRTKATTMPTTTKMVSTSQTNLDVDQEDLKIMREIPIEQVPTSTSISSIMQTSDTFNMTPQITKNMEASALSAFLVPGGQLPPVAASGINTRPLGRSTITKIPSPYIEPNNENEPKKSKEKTENLISKDNHLSGSSVDETVKHIHDSDFNWYFQNYNNSDLEPYVSIVYGSNLSSSIKDNYLSIFVYVYYLIRHFL